MGAKKTFSVIFKRHVENLSEIQMEKNAQNQLMPEVPYV